MKSAVALLVAALMMGCSHAQIDVNGGASINAHTHSNAVAALLITGMFLAAAAEEVRKPQPLPSPYRGIIEQDCTRPVDMTVTLKCR
jgi:triosephosphate isomerase